MAPARRREKSAAAVKKPAPGSKPKKSGRKEPAVQPAPEPRVLPPAPANMDTPWVEVARRKKKGKSTAAPTSSAQPPKPTRQKEPKLRPPRSAAVVISLTPAAVAKGMTYKGVLTDAQNRVDLTGLDISRLKPKFTATGAPILPTPVPSGEAVVGGRKPNDVDDVEGSVAERPMEGVAGTSGATITDVDSESSGSVSSVRSRRLWRRHSRSIDSVSLHFTSDTDEPAPKTLATDGRGRGRPPSVGKYAGLKKAQKERDRLKREEARRKATEELDERLRHVKSPLPPRADADEDRPVLKEDLRECGQIVRAIVRKSGNLKGTSQKALNRVINLIIRYVEQPESAAIARPRRGKEKRLRRKAPALEATVKGLQEENASLRRRRIVGNGRRLGVQARVESALMGPAQRPTLAHEKKAAPGDTQLPVTSGFVGGAPNNGKPAKNKGKGKAKGPAEPAPPLSAPATGPTSAPPTAVPGPSRAPAKTGGKKKKTKKDTPAQAAPEPRPLPPAPTSMETPWVVVAKKNRKKKERPAPTSAANTQPPQSTRRAEPKLRPPRSAAVIISLTPAAVAKGMTYKGVLTDAQNRVDLTGLDITRLRPKFAATGAPMYEVPGANSEERADSLAARLRECFRGSEDIRTTRPTKTVELRLSELDYTATPQGR
ncbi:serine/arginine repetitive matrix protein 1-like [Manduca sexta]|uniref:serine/arginine repetitive matrix protein 1-like n=1 Tax=Manduca sexta TaxID=7130 RepID=UPI00188ECB56|nr:serine/arginine repetitive matrix protein 1-like [Manduca sexta]